LYNKKCTFIKKLKGMVKITDEKFLDVD